MLSRFFGNKIHSYLHILGISGLAFGLPLNKVVMSISMMFIILNILLEGKFKTYYLNLKNNKLFLLGLSYFIIHVVGLIWTSNYDYGFHDLRVILPLLVILVGVSAKPITKEKDINIILISFLASLFITSTINFGVYQNWFGDYTYKDIRELSLFSSHVRYAILISMGIAISIHLLINKKFRPVLVLLILWLCFYTYFSQIISGLLTFTGVALTYFFFWLSSKNKWIAFGSIATLFLGIILMLTWVLKPISYNSEDYKNLPKATAEGNFYFHALREVSPETGKPIHIFVCDKELEREWSKKSSVDYHGYDIKNQLIRTTLIRYLSSKDYKKDAEGFSKLTHNDIENIENGNASVYNTGLLARVYSLQMQLNNTGDPNGHSLLQRLEFWKTGLQIGRENWLIGVGTGDVQIEFDEKYAENNTSLKIENRHRAHNMYLTVLISFGIFGLFLFLWMHFEFAYQMILQQHKLGVAFIVIILLSYTIEDTLETQTGITFFALFYTLFISSKKIASKD